jgi:hypothetical protein
MTPAVDAPDAPELALVRGAPVLAAAPTVAPAALATAPDPDRFYDSDYTPTLVSQIMPIVATEAPVMLRRVARLIARLHGFKRTGKEIVRVVREASAPLGLVANAADGEEILWGHRVGPAKEIPFRGLRFGVETRPWEEVPYPEKLGFARDFLAHADAPRAMAEALALGRLTGPMRLEFETLLAAAGAMQD